MIDRALTQVSDTTGIPSISAQEARNAAITMIETVLRLHGLTELPDDDDPLYEEILDELDRCLDRLGIQVKKLEEVEQVGVEGSGSGDLRDAQGAERGVG